MIKQISLFIFFCFCLFASGLFAEKKTQLCVNPRWSKKYAGNNVAFYNSVIKTNDGNQVDRMQVRYMAEGGTDFKYREILLGGLAPVPTNERSVLEIHYESVQGLEVLGANQFFKLH